jgi:hypothetical protein
MVKLYALILTLFLALGSIHANNQPVAFKLYPNPMTGDVLQVNLNIEYKLGQAYTFVITNIIGQVVHTRLLSEDEVKRGYFSIQFDEVKLDKGVYLTKLINGNQSSVQKLVVR